MAKKGCFGVVHLREDNARFALLAVVMTIYMVSGATVFMFLERDNELVERNRYYHVLESFLKSNPEVNRTQLQRLLAFHADAAGAGLLRDRRQRWDFGGSFYFVATVVSTIGKWHYTHTYQARSQDFPRGGGGSYSGESRP